MGEWKDLDVSGFDINLNDRLTILEEQYELVEYYYTVTSGTTGTVSIPTGYTIEMDRFTNGIDAIVAKEGTDGRPTDAAVYTSLGVIISTTLAANGNYVFSGIPSGYNVCIIYYLKGKRKYRDNLTFSNILGTIDYNPNPGTGTVNKISKFVTTKSLGDSNIEDTGTVVKIPVVTNIGDGGTTNYSQFEADGTLKFVGTATVFEDLNFAPNRGGNPATLPDYVTINNVTYREFTSANNQVAGDTQELPHAYKLSSLLYPHMHIFLKGGESIGTTGVTFTLYWEVRQSTGTTNGSTILAVTSAILNVNPHKVDIYNGSFAGSAELGAQLALTLARTGGDAGDIIVTSYGVHFEIDQVGSKELTSK